MKMDEKLRKTVMSAVFAALICVTTIMIQIPIYATGGYVNLGDCFIILAAWTIGTRASVGAAALGSALADIIAGYIIFAPGTFFIKGLVALTAALIASHSGKHVFLGRVGAAITAEAVMTAGYFLYEWFLLGSAEAAAAGIVGNLVQGAVAVVSSALLYTALEKTKAVKKFN